MASKKEPEDPVLHPVTPHGKITQVFKDVYFLPGSSQLAPLLQIPRAMIIVRHRGELTLIHTVRVDDDTLDELDALGTVTNIMNLGEHHGKDDHFYLQRYPEAVMYAWEDHPHKKGIRTDVALTPRTKLPFPRARLFFFKTLATFESALYLEDHRCLVSCDAVQNMIDKTYCSFFGGLMSEKMGFVAPCNIGPGLLMIQRQQRPAYDGPPLTDDLERLLDEVPFENLLPSHGVPIDDGTAADQLRATIERLGPEELSMVTPPKASKLVYVAAAASLFALVWAVNHLWVAAGRADA